VGTTYEHAIALIWCNSSHSSKFKPFYFFEKDGQVGISYNDEVFMLGYEKIPHYGCCSAGMLNPSRAQNLVSFFAQKDGAWYYVEIGVYE